MDSKVEKDYDVGVPLSYKSHFYFVILSPDNALAPTFDTMVQIGGNANIGYDFTQITAN